MQVKQLLVQVPYVCVKGNDEIEVKHLVYDSRKVEEGDIFVCLVGAVVDGHDFIQDVIQKGAKAIVVEKDVEVEGDVAVVKVENTRYALACMAAEYFERPYEKLTTIGITGTKGKTTTSYMIQKILERAGKKVGVIGTIGVVIGEEHYKTSNTTPESYDVQYYFKKMVEAGCEYVVMEVSSQGLKYNRVAGFTFDYGIFTNLTPDHIGPAEHDSLEDYIHAKSLLFSRCKKGILNGDDPHTKEMLANHTCEVETFGFQEEDDYRASDMQLLSAPGFLGVSFHVAGKMEGEVKVNIPGRFSVYNALSALALCHNLGIEEEAILTGLKEIRVRGRVEIVPYSDDFTVLIDYAHNAVSTESLLTTLKEYHPKRLITLFGAGGNRDRNRRYDMGEISGKIADFSIITSDNPRFEKPEAIIEDIKVGVERSNGKYIAITDRREAIHYALDHGQKGDIIALLGKGHEEYVEIEGKRYHFSEAEEIERYRKEKEEKKSLSFVRKGK